MKQIRNGVFETNSSSTHSMTVRGRHNPLSESCLRVENDEYVHTNFGEFGWGHDTLYSQGEKLSYLCTMAACAEGENVGSNDEYYETEGFKAIDAVIKEKCNCKGLVVDTVISKYECSNGTIYAKHDGYIDHQSLYTSLQAFLDDYEVSIEQIIFSSGVEIIIDNDNH